jgi:integrase
VYVDGHGQQLGPPKTEGAHGEHWLTPTAVELLKRRRELQAEEREAAPSWEEHVYEGERISLVFTTPTGGLVLRQTITKLVKQAAKLAGILVDLATHAGRRTVITLLYVEGDEALEDIAHFVGHAKPSTTGGYVKRLGRRARTVAERAAALLDAGGSNQSPADASNRASNGAELDAPSPEGSGR